MRLENVRTISEALVNFNLVPVSSLISERAEALILSLSLTWDLDHGLVVFESTFEIIVRCICRRPEDMASDKWEEEYFDSARQERKGVTTRREVRRASCRQILGGLHRIGFFPKDMKYSSCTSTCTCKVTYQAGESQKLSHAKGHISGVCQQRRSIIPTNPTLAELNLAKISARGNYKLKCPR